MGAVLAAVAFLVIVGGAAAAYFMVRPALQDAPVPASPDAPETTPSPSKADAPSKADQPARAPRAPSANPVSLSRIPWTAPSEMALDELAAQWSIPRDTLAELNPALAEAGRVAAGAKVVVYSDAGGPSASLGPPNDGRLVGGVPLPEGAAWHMPEDRTRAWATAETITAAVEALQAYGARFPTAPPLQIGDLSARRGGPIYGHQSHQSGRDVDIRLARNDTGEGFDAERNWFLVRTLIDTGDVRQIFLNRSEQVWLRAAADADVGEADAQTYFDLIDHEPGHTIHMHVRYGCAESDKRCVGYSLPDTDEDDAKQPAKIPGATPPRGASKVPGIRPKAGAKKKKKKKKKGKKRTLSPQG
ncbi:MAG: penicillin-insensitive murein endopeptidase [Nannocystaceae bacterium]|nr:penicillin-insensitive murein endopeptidase [bacterium]